MTEEKIILTNHYIAIYKILILKLFAVHTPDGAPCGLLNHLAMPVEIVTHPIDGSKIAQVLADLGMIPMENTLAKVSPTTYHVLLDGKVLGFVAKKDAPRIVDKLRILKIKKEEKR